MDNQLMEISSIYKQYLMRSPKFTQLLVSVPLFQKMNSNIFKIRQELGSNLSHNNISLLDYELKSIFFSYGTSLIPIQQMYTESHFNYLTDNIKIEFSPFLKDTFLLDEFIEILIKFYEHIKHPFHAALKEIISFSSNTYTIVTKRTLSNDEIEKIQRMYLYFSLEFITYTDFLKTLKPFDNVIFIGSPKLYSENILQHIKANHFYFILFDCYYNEFKTVQWIEHKRIIKNEDTPTIQKRHVHYSSIELIKEDVSEKVDSDVPFFKLEEPSIPETFIDSFLTAEASNPKDRLITCKLLELEGNLLLFEEVGPKAKCDVVTTEFLYERKHLNNMSINEYIVLIDFYHWDDRRKLADKHFEKDGILNDRKTIARLKNYLLERINKHGIERYTKILNRKLNLNLKEYQILGLTKKESFQLKDKKIFYKLLSYFTKDEETAKKYFKACTNLAKYHNRVGHIARNSLRNYLDENPSILENIDTFSRIKILGMEFLKVELYRIKRISTKTYDVPQSKVSIPLNFYNEEVI